MTQVDAAPGLGVELDAYVAQATDEYRDNAPPEGTGQAMLERALQSPEGLVLVAEREGQRIGYCVVGPLIDPVVGDRWPMVLALWVHPEFRHRGLAGTLMERARADLMARGYGFLAARAGHNDDALISMGERWGFVRHWDLMVRE